MTAAFSDPVSNNIASWAESSFNFIDDAVRVGATPTTGANEEVYEQDKITASSTNKWNGNNIAAIANRDVDYWRVYWHRSVGGDAVFQYATLSIGGVDQGAPDSAKVSAGGNWFYSEWSADQNLDSDITGLVMGLVLTGQGNGDESEHASCVYIHCEHSDNGGGGGGGGGEVKSKMHLGCKLALN